MQKTRNLYSLPVAVISASYLIYRALRTRSLVTEESGNLDTFRKRGAWSTCHKEEYIQYSFPLLGDCCGGCRGILCQNY